MSEWEDDFSWCDLCAVFWNDQQRATITRLVGKFPDEYLRLLNRVPKPRAIGRLSEMENE